MRRILFLLILFSLSLTAAAGDEPAVQALEKQLLQLQEEMQQTLQGYQERILGLEEEIRRLKQAQEDLLAAREPEPEEGILPPLPAAPPRGNAMNPAISLIPDFTFSAGNDPRWTASDPIQLRELEISFSANIDPFASAFATLAAHRHEAPNELEARFVPGEEDGDHEAEEGWELDVEEAYAVFPGLPGGFSLKVGKFFSAFGKENQSHLHMWYQVDRPLVFSLLGGEGLNGVGVSLNRILPTPWASDLTLEITGGRDGYLFGGRRSDLSYLLAWRNFWDLTDNANLEAQLSLAAGKNAAGRTTKLGNLAFTYRYRPLASLKRESLLWRTEYVAKRYETYTGQDGAYPGAERLRQEQDDPHCEVDRLTERSQGLFSYIDWQFARGWFLGLRGDWVHHEFADLEDKGGSLVLTWFPSEYQKWRLQYQRASYGGIGTRDAVILQFEFSLGPHGAHPF